MSPILRVAAAQIAFDDDIEENTRTILQTIAQCAARGVDLCVFPEAALTGYSPILRRARPASDWPRVREALAAVSSAASERRIGVVVGNEAWTDSGWVNRLSAYDRDGELLAEYDKVHLTRDDLGYYRSGRSYPTFYFDGVCCGLQICYDARFPDGYRALLEKGAQVVLQGFCGAGTGTWKVPVLAAHLRSRAAETGCFVVAANVAGPLQIVVSQIIDPLGLVLAAANQDCIELISAELNLDRIADSEIRADWLARFRNSGL